MFCCSTEQLTECPLGLNFNHVIPENNYKHFTNVLSIFDCPLNKLDLLSLHEYCIDMMTSEMSGYCLTPKQCLCISWREQVTF